ncbi:uncharacterized protein LOC114648260 [Erpetoichthys calabaricus]|uniref:uncharacterized protein LOC114648260 n=1 Tax=Erpetoichthys calabaricus TaxID=27687 RepID=UPI00223461C6|nr:uncharacterized protein LOC114648260 [Erpetoichthys calabaricus]
MKLHFIFSTLVLAHVITECVWAQYTPTTVVKCQGDSFNLMCTDNLNEDDFNDYSCSMVPNRGQKDGMGGHEVNNHQEYENLFFLFVNVQPTNSGTYTCKTGNGNTLCSINLTVTADGTCTSNVNNVSYGVIAAIVVPVILGVIISIIICLLYWKRAYVSQVVKKTLETQVKPSVDNTYEEPKTVPYYIDIHSFPFEKENV